MGIRPCRCCGRRFVGRAQHLYATVIDGATEEKSQGAHCPRCFDRKIDWLVTHARIIPEGGLEYDVVADEHQCLACGKDVNDNSVVFATDYARMSDRRDWYSPLCPFHAEEAQMVLVQQQLEAL